MKIFKLTEEIIFKKISEFIEIDQVIDTDETWRRENFIMDLDGKWNNSYIMCQNNEIAGYIICSVKNKHILHIHRLAVKKKFQDRGIGTQLIDKVIENADGYIKYIALMAHKDNKKARRFYEKKGFKNICIVGDRNMYRREL